MHLAEPKNQGRTKQTGLTYKVAVKLAIAPKYVGITRVKLNEVFFRGVVDLLREITAIQRVLGQDRINQMCGDEAAERALVSKCCQLTTIADSAVRHEDGYHHGQHGRVIMEPVRTEFRGKTVVNGNVARKFLSRPGFGATQPCGVD